MTDPMPKLPVLSLWRPWPTLILHHGKDVENRTWATKYRGDLLLAGAIRWDDALSWPVNVSDDDRATLRNPSFHPRGIVGVVEVYGMCTGHLTRGGCDCSPWAQAGQVHWLLRNPRPFTTPVHHTGRQQLHQVPDENWPAIEQQLKEVTARV